MLNETEFSNIKICYKPDETTSIGLGKAFFYYYSWKNQEPLNEIIPGFWGTELFV